MRCTSRSFPRHCEEVYFPKFSASLRGGFSPTKQSLARSNNFKLKYNLPKRDCFAMARNEVYSPKFSASLRGGFSPKFSASLRGGFSPTKQSLARSNNFKLKYNLPKKGLLRYGSQWRVLPEVFRPLQWGILPEVFRVIARRFFTDEAIPSKKQ